MSVLADGDASAVATTIAVGQDHPSGVVADATHVYWANAGGAGADAGVAGLSGQVMMAPK